MQHVATTASNLMTSWTDEDNDREQKEEKENKVKEQISVFSS